MPIQIFISLFIHLYNIHLLYSVSHAIYSLNICTSSASNMSNKLFYIHMYIYAYLGNACLVACDRLSLCCHSQLHNNSLQLTQTRKDTYLLLLLLCRASACHCCLLVSTNFLVPALLLLPQLFILRYKLPTYQCNTAVVVAIAFISGNKCHVNSDCLNVTQLESVGDTESEWKNNIKLGRERESAEIEI